jgi:hypothetical protein
MLNAPFRISYYCYGDKIMLISTQVLKVKLGLPSQAQNPSELAIFLQQVFKFVQPTL